MKRWSIIGLIGVGLVLFLIFRPKAPSSSSLPIHESISMSPPYDEDVYLQALAKEVPASVITDNIVGGIVPHHLLARDLIVHFFAGIQQAMPQPQSIIWIAPNHFESGNAIFTSGSVSWQTPFGPTHVSEPILSQLETLSDLNLDNDIIASEAAVLDMMPWLAHYWPNTPVTPILVSKRATLSHLESLSEKLVEINVDHRMLVIATVDFSHYLSTSKADSNDTESWELIQARDYEQLNALTSDHMDSPGALITLLKYADLLGASKVQLLERSNSGHILGDKTVGSTGYITATVQLEPSTRLSK